MILLCGIPSESPLAYAIAAAESRAVEHIVFSQRTAGHTDFVVNVDGPRPTGSMGFGGDPIPLDAIVGVYVRLTDAVSLPEHRPNRGTRRPRSTTLRSGLLHSALLDWLEFAECRVLNRPSAMASNMSKPYQAQLIARAGFAVPPTLVTNDPEAVREFSARHGRLVYKSTSSIRSIVQELDDARSGDLDRIADLPTQFQALVPGDDVRVHVVGQRVFATEIRCEVVDYRYAARNHAEATFVRYELPAAVAGRCVALADSLDLPLCGIDLRRTPDDDYYCLEVNPSPAYSFYQERTGQPIADAIVDYLVG